MTEPMLLSPDWQVPSRVRAFVSTRDGGGSGPPFDTCNLADHVGDEVAVVAANRELVRGLLPGKPAMQWLRQVHGKRVVRINAAQAELEADGLATDKPLIALCVLTADCLPVFLADRNGKEIAVVHAGWRGLAAGVIQNALSSLRTPPADLVAWLGPAIGPCHFEVGDDVRDSFAADQADSPLREAFQPGVDTGKYQVDIYAITTAVLQRAGVTAVSGGGFCTVCEPERFYSYRRDGVTGRNLSVAYLSDA